MASLISGAMNSAAWTGAGMIPVFVVGLAYLRYSMYDPESRVIDVQEVNITLFYRLLLCSCPVTCAFDVNFHNLDLCRVAEISARDDPVHFSSPKSLSGCDSTLGIDCFVPSIELQHLIGSYIFFDLRV